MLFNDKPKTGEKWKPSTKEQFVVKSIRRIQ
jgi:hypothetical protein